MHAAALLEAMELNLADHAAFLSRHLRGSLVWDEPSLLIVDSGVPSDTFNIICRARLAEDDADQRVGLAIDHFRSKELPFSWWVGPTSTPADLGKCLAAHSLPLAETEVAMSLDLSQMPDAAPLPPAVEIRRVQTKDDLAAYASVIAAGWDPPDQALIDVHVRAADSALLPNSPARYYLGYLEGVPVATSECFLAHGVAGIYNVATLTQARRRGIGTAITMAALKSARLEGYRTAVLQASAEGQDVYARLGFIPCGEFHEYR